MKIKKIKIKNTNIEILVPKSFDLRESPIFLFNDSLRFTKSLKFYIYYKSEERPLPIYIILKILKNFQRKKI